MSESQSPDEDRLRAVFPALAEERVEYAVYAEVLAERCGFGED